MQREKEDYEKLIAIAEAKGVHGMVEQDAFAVSVLRTRKGLDTRYEYDGLFPLIEDGKLVEKPFADLGIYR